MRCDKCEHWERKSSIDGKCAVFFGSKVEIQVSAGWDGGFVSAVLTEPDFFCAAFSPKSEVDHD